MLTSHNPVIEGAHAVGRALHTVAEPDLLAVVAEDVDREIDAVRRAILGDLSGRAGQAETLAGAEAAPTQVAEVHRALEAAEILNQSVKTVRRRISDGTLPAYRIGPRLIRVRVEDLDESCRRIPSARPR